MTSKVEPTKEGRVQFIRETLLLFHRSLTMSKDGAEWDKTLDETALGLYQAIYGDLEQAEAELNGKH